jgi:hypothetical protein
VFIVSVRATTPTKSRDEISVRGEGYDNPSVTIAAIVLNSNSLCISEASMKSLRV